MKLEEKIIKLWKRNAWSQEELAEKLDVTRQTVSKWELGQTTPDADKLTKMATIFNVTANDLLDENTEPAEKESKVNNNGRPTKIIIIVIILISNNNLAIIIIVNNNVPVVLKTLLATLFPYSHSKLLFFALPNLYPLLTSGYFEYLFSKYHPHAHNIIGTISKITSIIKSILSPLYYIFLKIIINHFLL